MASSIKSAQFGIEGERVTAILLREQGFTIRNTNYRKMYGEIDIIASKGSLWIFVEVKARNKEYFDGSDLITRSKQRKIILVAKEYMARHHLDDVMCRFDVSFVTSKNGSPSVCYIPDAFGDE